MAVNVLIDGLTADMQVYRAGRVENPGPQLLRIAREKWKWGDRLMAEEIVDTPEDLAIPKREYYPSYYTEENGVFKCKLCGQEFGSKSRITGHLTMGHFKRKGVDNASNSND